MRRRQVLQAAGGLGIAAVAGCLGTSDGNGGDDQSTDTRSPTRSPTPTSTPTSVPVLSGSSLAVRNVESGSETQSAAVSFTDGEVVVDGTTTGNNGCYTAVLERASVDADTLRVRVKATEDPDAGDMCTEALVEIDYEATFTFDGRVPKTVVVEHHSLGDVKEVTRQSR